MQIEDLIEQNRERLNWAAPFRCFRKEIDRQRVEVVEPRIRELFGSASFFYENSVMILFRKLEWDSAFFQRSIYKLDFVLFPAAITLSKLSDACNIFAHSLPDEKTQTEIWTELPSEDILLIQALNMAGFRLVETRMRYFYTNLQQFDGPRAKVRPAVPADVPELRRIAASARNPYDRFHADVYSSDEEGDRFLAQYAEASVNGYCDETLVPDLETVDAFMAANYPELEVMGVRYAHPIVAAVGLQNRGWYAKLLSECLHRGKSKGAEFALMVTQSTNGAVIHTLEKLGAKFGSSAHILSFRRV